MIGRLTGQLLEKQPPGLLLDVQGVGYEVEAPLSSFQALPAIGERVTLFTHLVIREDAHCLYGFVTGRERELFRALIRVSGVGPKLALTLLSGMRVDDFLQALHHNDITALTRIPGVGRKTAERLVIEMQDRAQALPGGPGAATGPGDVAGAAAEAVNALIALGYKSAEAGRLVERVDATGLASEEIIRQALQKSVK